MELIKGIEVVETIEENTVLFDALEGLFFSLVLGAIFALLICGAVILIIGAKEKESFWIILGIVLIVGAIIVAVTFVLAMPARNNTTSVYRIRVHEEQVDWKEFYQKYEILGHDDFTYKIIPKE